MFADLHLHSNFSDGTYPPEELVQHAERHRLSAMALTDHDTVDGCARMTVATEKAGIEFVPGAEITAEADGTELHLLAYLVDYEDAELLREFAKFQQVRQDRIREMVARLNKLGIPLKPEAVFALANCNAPGRPHVTRALIQAGFCATLEEAFERYLKKNRPAWVPKFKISAAGAIELIHRAGGVAVMAHPGISHCDELIPELVESGMDGIECYHSRHSSATCEHYYLLAQEHELLITGGSDCHGMNKGKPLIGSIKLPYQHVQDLKERSAEVRERNRQPASASS